MTHAIVRDSVNGMLLAVKHYYKLSPITPTVQFQLLTFCSHGLIGFLVLGSEVRVFNPAVKILQ